MAAGLHPLLDNRSRGLLQAHAVYINEGEVIERQQNLWNSQFVYQLRNIYGLKRPRYRLLINCSGCAIAQ